MPIRRLKRATLAACCAPLLIAVGCSSGDTPGAQPTGRAPQTLISDQLHNGGTQGFLFLPPMVPRPAQLGNFVPTVRPTVRIDEVNAEGLTIRTLATFTTTTGPSRERLRTHIANEPCDSDDNDGDTDPEGYFYARWKTNNANLSASARYRVRVLVPAAGGGTREIGFADVDVVRNQQEFRSVDTVNFTPLLNGHVLRIKFRIDRPAVDADADGVFDWVDNCPAQANATQTDTNHDRQGDACECVGVTCVASDICHAAGVCDPINGMCSNPDAPAGTACSLSNATALCAGGACGVASCNAGHADCNAAATDGCETPTTTLANCGACGVACTTVAHSTPGCGTGTCAITCDAGWADANGDRADGCELDVTTDTNCGVPGNACVSGLGDVNTCVSGSCSTIACASDTANCNTSVADGCEASLAGDVAHCGACNHACAVANATPSCVAGACAVGTCHAGFTDCNGLAADGCEITPASDVAHCGGCGNACSLPNASPVCAAGSCAVGACTEGFVDLDHDASNGCEVNLATNVAHCGAVGNHCVMPNGTAACTGGQCVLASCNAGFDNCTTGAGCESDLTSVTSCGGCGVTCASGEHSTPTCGAAGCGLTCEPGFGNCDGNAANGCEVDLTSDGGHCGTCATACRNATTCQAGACSTAVCVSGYADCNGLATDGCEAAPASDTGHCGACGHACSFANAAPQCIDGGCGFAVCDPGFADCDGQQANGCEVALGTDASHCGGCGTVCTYAHATGVCGDSACALGACDAGWANCDGNAANGCEVSLGTDLNHCGTCATACAAVANATATCGGTCGFTCDATHADCDGDASNGCEVDTSASLGNCGACGNACTQGRTCQAGACSASACTGTLANCDGVESNGCEASTATDVTDCGACGHVCSFAHASATCANSACALGTCAAGFANCDGNAANGCEVDLSSDAAHCGACNTACATANGTAACVSGACAVGSCDADFADCDHLAGDGCEVSSATDVANCGGCGTVCPSRPSALATCLASSCGYACASGRRDCDGVATNGCEVDANADSANCGGCGVVCTQGRTCVSGACSTAVCVSGTGDCDHDAANGCEVALDSSAGHCGTCGNACSYANGAGVCTAGSCSLAACNAGFSNCNASSTDGCETNLTSTATSCGACGYVCTSPNGTAACYASACGLAACNAGYANCDAVAANGCETSIATDAANCGGCGVACAANYACQAGTCVLPKGATWQFDDGCGSATVADTSGNGDTGTTAGSPTWLNGSSCHSGGCLSFSGTTQQVTANYTAAQKFGTGPFSVSAWIRVASGSTGTHVVVGANRCNIPESWLMYIDNGLPRFGTYGSGSTVAQSNSRVDDGAWHFLVGRRSGTSLQLVVDGITVASGTVHATYNSDGAGTLITIGNFSCGSAFTGRIDDVRITDHALTTAEITALRTPDATTPATATDSANCGGCGVVCASGYACTSSACTDINECLTNNGGCGTSLTCTNTAGSRTCACSAGYTLSGSTCVDVNECFVGNGNCAGDATCTNTPGSRTCTCSPSSLCSGVCRFLQTDSSHCGACGHACASGQICLGGVCGAPPSWAGAVATSPLAGRTYHSAVWTGTQMIVWGGQNGDDNDLDNTLVVNTIFADGAIYTPATNTWTYLPAGAPNAPTARYGHTALWTGSRMIVWGGLTDGGTTLTSSTPAAVNTGASYDPVTNTWTPLSATGAPPARYGHTAVWTGEQMIVWGGSATHYNLGGVLPSGGLSGAMYNPATNGWTAVPVGAAGEPSTRRMNHTAVWTGSRMIVWGGQGPCTQYADGGVFDPATGLWQNLPAGAAGAPGPRGQHSALWTGTQMIIWGGATNPNVGDGGMYNPATNTWRYMVGEVYPPGNTWMMLPNEPGRRFLHSAVWTGSRMVVFGGASYCGGCGPSALCSDSSHVKGDGAEFDPVSGSWASVPSSLTNSPGTRVGHTAVWTGTQMIVWGGQRVSSLRDGAILTP